MSDVNVKDLLAKIDPKNLEIDSKGRILVKDNKILSELEKARDLDPGLELATDVNAYKCRCSALA